MHSQIHLPRASDVQKLKCHAGHPRPVSTKITSFSLRTYLNTGQKAASRSWLSWPWLWCLRLLPCCVAQASCHVSFPPTHLPSLHGTAGITDAQTEHLAFYVDLKDRFQVIRLWIFMCTILSALNVPLYLFNIFVYV